jgi:L-iditol 2-dehydrogenase
VKVLASGICGSDVLEWYRVPKAPRVLGHEATGIIEKKGKKITQHKIGDRVFVSHHVPCNKCRYCKKGHHTACQTLHTTNYYPGGLAQYIRVPRINVEYGVYELPRSISFEEGTFIEPLACVLRSQRLGAVNKEDSLLIIGSGVSGILQLQLARFRGLKQTMIADINTYRLELAQRFGANVTLNAKKNLAENLKEINNGRLADKVMVCTGAAQAALTAMDCVDKGGTVMFFAVPEPKVFVPVPINKFWRNEIAIKTSYGAAPRDLVEALSILSQKKLNIREMITHRLGITRAAEGFALTAAAEKSLKVIIKPHEK